MSADDVPVEEPRDDGSWHADDMAALNAAATGRVIPVSLEDLRRLSVAAGKVFASFEDELESLNDGGGLSREQAEYVRLLRVEQNYTWRAVAATTALEWGCSWASNQLAGMAVCDAAAKLFGEDYMAEPWN